MPINVLIVEDDRASAKLLEISLRRLSCNICGIAGNGPEAIRLVETQQPDIVLMDINLPGGFDGIEATEMIRATYRIPVLYITANNEDETIRRAIGSDPIGYLLKPYSVENLRVMIETGVYRHKAERKIRDNEQFLEVLLAGINDGVVAADAGKIITYVNASACRLLLVSDPGACIGEHIDDVVRLKDELTEKPISIWDYVHLSAEGIMKDALLITTETTAVPVEFMISPLGRNGDTDTGFLLTLQDITLRKQAEAMLRRHNEQLEADVLARTIEIRSKNLLLEKEIQQRTVYEEELKRALDKEKEINTFRSNIVTTLSHEFRTPLTTLQSSSELVERSLQGVEMSGRPQHHLAQIKKAIKNLLDLLNDILMIEKIESPKDELDIKPIDTQRFFEELVESMRIGIGKDHLFEFRHNPMPMQLNTDTRLLTQILNNLLSNAFKYSQPRSPVLLLLYFGPEFLRITVTDKGIGIPKENLPRLFDTFYRAGNVGNVSGTGLGLAILKKSVDRLGGEIAVDSEPGSGSRFSVTLPYH
jgi:hypothetical protein